MKMKLKSKAVTDTRIKMVTDISPEAPYGSFTGYCSVFGNKDSVGDIVVPGAYKAGLENFKQDGFVAMSHDWSKIPIGSILEAEEDDYGLKVKVAFHRDPEAQRVRNYIQDRLDLGKSVKMSIGYQVNDFEDTRDARYLKAINLYEASVVTVPANGAALVTGVKAAGQLNDGDSDEEEAAEPDWLERLEDLEGLNGLTFLKHSEIVLDAVHAYVKRAQAIAELRKKDGRKPSALTAERMASVKENLSTVLAMVDEYLPQPEAAAPETEEKAGEEAETLPATNDISNEGNEKGAGDVETEAETKETEGVTGAGEGVVTPPSEDTSGAGAGGSALDQSAEGQKELDEEGLRLWAEALKIQAELLGVDFSTPGK